MYAKHDKNINRNKSFHPLTYSNLRKTEEIKEKQEKDAQYQQARQKELEKDQEQRRYDALVMSASSSGMGVGFTTAAASRGGALRLVDDIFAEDDVEQSAPPPTTSTSTTAAGHGVQPHAFLAKFKKEDTGRTEGDVVNTDVSKTSMVGCKREREEPGTVSPRTGPAETANAAGKTTTGFITTSEVARLRAEHELVKKRQLDPLLKVQRHQDRTVAEAARAHEMQRRREHSSEDSAAPEQSTDKPAKQAIQDILKQLQARRRARQ